MRATRGREAIEGREATRVEWHWLGDGHWEVGTLVMARSRGDMGIELMDAVLGEWYWYGGRVGSGQFWGAPRPPAHLAICPCRLGLLLWAQTARPARHLGSAATPVPVSPWVGAPWGSCGAYLGPPPGGTPARSHPAARLTQHHCTASLHLHPLCSPAEPACVRASALQKESRYVFSRAH